MYTLVHIHMYACVWAGVISYIYVCNVYSWTASYYDIQMKILDCMYSTFAAEQITQYTYSVKDISAYKLYVYYIFYTWFRDFLGLQIMIQDNRHV